MTRAGRVGVAGMVIAGLGLGCGTGDKPRPFPAEDARYVGSEACRDCHQAEYALWKGSDHDRAMEPADSTTVLGDFDDAVFTHRGVTSRFTRRDGAYFVETEGPDGVLREYPVAYTFGVDPLQQYLVPFPDGRYQALSLCWDTRPAEAGGQRWFHLYAGEAVPPGDELHWTSPSQNWNHMCAECHSTDLRKNHDAATGRFNTTWAGIDVGCEACHGPGSAHAAWALTRPPGGEGGERPSDRELRLAASTGDRDRPQWVPDPDRPGFLRRDPPRADDHVLDMCARCHARRGTLATEYRFGRPLADTHRPSLLAEGLYEPDGQILDEVYVWGSFLQSRMHAAGVTCTDCHDPHRAELKLPGNGVCASCHEPARFDMPGHTHHPPGPGSACSDCHMPSRLYMVVDERHDHGFRIPRPDLTRTLGVPNACDACHADKGAAWSEQAMLRWYGTGWTQRPSFAGAFLAARAGDPAGGPALRGLVGDASWPAIVRATAFTLLAGYPGEETLASVREHGVGDPSPLVRVGALEALDGFGPAPRVALAGPALADSILGVRDAAVRALLPVPPGSLPPAVRDDFTGAGKEYEASQLADADRADALHNLGLLHASRGDAAGAERWYRLAIERGPHFAPAYVNLADLHRAQGRDDLGEAVLRQGIATLVDPSSLRYALGLLLVRADRREEALRELAAAAAGPSADFGYAYGVALHDAGRGRDAVRALAGTHGRFPFHRDTVLALALYSAEIGDRAGAVEYARTLTRLAPDDPRARQLLQGLEAGGDP